MATLGPWILRTTLSDANDKQIVRVVSKSLSGNWVVKIKTNKTNVIKMMTIITITGIFVL